MIADTAAGGLVQRIECRFAFACFAGLVALCSAPTRYALLCLLRAETRRASCSWSEQAPDAASAGTHRSATEARVGLQADDLGTCTLSPRRLAGLAGLAGLGVGHGGATEPERVVRWARAICSRAIWHGRRRAEMAVMVVVVVVWCGVVWS